MDAKIYEKYGTQVYEYMKNLIDCLEQDYDVIPNSWRISLDLIADNYNMYIECSKQIKEDGLMRYDEHHGLYYKHPLIGVMNAAQTQLKDLLKSFALTPMSKTKIKAFRGDGVVNEMEYLDKLMN